MDYQKSNRQNLADLVELVNNSYISSIERVVTEMIRVINDPTSSAKDLKEIIEVDPPLAGKVLQRANSAYYARRRRISEIQQAIILIGFDSVKELALSQKVYELFADDITIYGYSRVELWKHSIAVALLAKLIYRREFGQRGDNAYAAGLLHTIGIIVEDQFLHDEFIQILKHGRQEEKNLIDLEMELFGYHHADVAKAVLSSWDLPEELVAAIGYHYHPQRGSSRHTVLIITLAIADYLCQESPIGYVHTPSRNRDAFESYLKHLNIKSKALEYILNEVELQIRKMEKQGWFLNVA